MEMLVDEQTNTGRQPELDWARGLAVFFMILVHVKIDLPGFPLTEPYSKVIEFFGSPLAAPTFMILMGAGMVYSQNGTPKKLAQRGLQLLGLHYALNFLAFALPKLVKLRQTNDPVYWESFLYNLFGADILAFAGLTFLFFAAKEKLRLKTVHLLLAALVLCVLNYLLTGPVHSMGLEAVTGLFVKTGEYSYFPFFAWVGYPVMGYVFGGLLKKCADKGAFYKYLFAFSALILIAVSLGAVKYGFPIWTMNYMPGAHFGPEDYYYQDFIQYILVGGICFSWLSVLYALSRVKALRLVGAQLSRWSRNTTPMYFVHYILVSWLAALNIIAFPMNPYVNLGTGVAIVIIADAAVALYKKAVRRPAGR